jgi:uracil-DNA glycosylase family protein
MPTTSYPTAEPFLPRKLSLSTLTTAAKSCKGCDLYKNATQTVFGEGPANARVIFVGEQPGDQEDQAGHPFVGPAGNLLNSMLEKVGIDRGEVYVTNAVKHFKWEPRGKRRIHSKPSARQVTACKPWLKAEVEVIKPDVIVALGATAAQAIIGKDFKVTQGRGKPIIDNPWAPCIVATVHPSSLLRAPDEAARREAFRRFEEDLRVVKRQMDKLDKPQRKPQHARRADADHPGQRRAEAESSPPSRTMRSRHRATHS